MYGGIRCQFDEDRTSLFPDVLLPPGKFEVLDVKRYKSSEDCDACDEQGAQIDPNDAAEHAPKLLKPSRGRVRYEELTDEQYAAHMLVDVDNFVDVSLKVKRMMQLPKQE